MTPPLLEAVAARVRDVPDWPRPGIVFKDLTPVLADPLLFHGVVSALAARVATLDITEVVGIEARGFILGGALALLRPLKATMIALQFHHRAGETRHFRD